MSRNAPKETHPTHIDRFEVSVAPGDAGSSEGTRDVVAATVDRHRATVRAGLTRAKRAAEILTRYRQQLDELVGERARRRFGAFSRKQRESVYGLTDYRPEHFNPEVLRGAKQEAQGESHAMMRRAKVDPDALEKVHAAAAKRWRRALSPKRAKGATLLEPVPLEEVPDQLLHGSGPSWFVKGPPYDGVLTTGDGFHFGGSVEHHFNTEVQENPFKYITGRFGSWSRYLNKSASDWDALFLTLRTAVGFWFTPAQAGSKQVWLKIRSERSQADVWLDDELGWSDSWNDFFTRFEISVQQLQGVQGQTGEWHVDVDGEPDSEWYHMPLVGNNTEVWIPFTVPFPPGPVFIWVIANDHRHCGLNDVSTDATLETDYVLEEVHIIG